MKNLQDLTTALEDEALRVQKANEIKKDIEAKEEDAYDGFSDETLKLIPSPNFSDATPIGTFLPVNMANEIVTNLSKLSQQVDLVDFIKDELGYTSRVRVAMCFGSEQIDAIAMAIKSFQRENAFILGDMAGIGKGRVCAALMRYAYQKNLIPIFFTHKPYLFSDIYRDLIDIDGFGLDSKGKMIMPKPLILHKDGFVLDSSDMVAARPLKQRILNDICSQVTERIGKGKSIELPTLEIKGNWFELRQNSFGTKEAEPKSEKISYNCVFLPYSTLSMSRTTIKQNFLEAIAPKSIAVFDESHNAASAKEDANILKRALPIVKACKAVLFSSATYAKSPQVFSLYVVKTALRTAVPTLDSITSALKVGGENVSEYIASGLASEGEMIRRERSFGNCKKVTEYVGSVMETNFEGKVTYRDLPDDTQRQFYDEAIGYFKELRDFSKSDLAKDAITMAIRRKCQSLNRVIVPEEEFKRAASGSQQLKDDFVRNFNTQWILTYRPDSISRYKSTFRENLFLAIKAKFSADKIIDCLINPVTYTNVDGTTHTAPMKPVVAIRNTGEAIFNELKLQEGQELDNDFSEYLRAIYNKMFVGDFTLRRVDANIFETKASLADRGINYIEERHPYTVEMTDFADNGFMITNIQSRLNAYSSDLPFSVIDYIKDRIESTQRPSSFWTDSSRTTPKYGFASSEFFRLEEATSRKFMLVKQPNGKWRFSKNNRIPSTTQVFRAFNNGICDVMLINVVASTGGSAQSNPKEGSDTRPRNMFIIQFELDINTEVQKRGRVNRTGQLNSPTYTYIITKIPVELRTYLMFRKKLRKLDANTSADQTASSATSEITDHRGNPIEDIFNAYGFKVFRNDFIEQPEYMEYGAIFNSLPYFSRALVAATDNQEAIDYGIEQFNVFVRELELYPSAFQETFFDVMADKYSDEIKKLKAANEYQLELQTKPYRAKLKQQVVIQLNSGTSVFSLPLFMADYYTLDDKKIWSKDQLNQKMNELAAKFSLGRPELLSPEQAYIELMIDYENTFRTMKDELISIFRRDNEPKRELFSTEEEFNTQSIIFEGRVAALSNGQERMKGEMTDLLRFFKPGKAILMDGIPGIFVGYNIKDTGSKFKYSEGSIEFVFAFLAKYPVYRLKKSKDYDELRGIMRWVNTYDAYISSASSQNENFGIGTENMIGDYKKKVAEWKPDLTRRTTRRFLSGNILSAIIEANKKRAKGEITNWALQRFNDINGKIITAVELKYGQELSAWNVINENNEDLSVAADNVDLINFAKQLPVAPDVFEPKPGEVIWNAETDEVNDRAIVLFCGYQWFEGIAYKKLFVEIVQRYYIDSKTKEIKEVKDKSELYNKIYYDADFNNKYARYNEVKGVERKTIKYAIKRIEVDYSKGEFIAFGAKNEDGEVEIKKEKNKSGKGKDIKGSTTTYNKYNIKYNRFVFNLDNQLEEDVARDFFKDLYRKYEVCFNFRSSAAELYNVELQQDVDVSQIIKAQKEDITVFPAGDYQYRFTRRMDDEFAKTIPNFKELVSGVGFGGVILSQPISPILLKSYNLKPFNLPSDVMVKLCFGVLNDLEKVEFARELEEKAKDEGAYEVGEYVRDYLTSKSVDKVYLFGDLRVTEYGQIFKDFALKVDILSEYTVAEETEKTIAAKPKKNKITFEDAERFLMLLNP